MDYSKYLKNGFKLNEFNNIEELRTLSDEFKAKESDLGTKWHDISVSAVPLLKKTEPLTDDDKKILNDAIQIGETYKGEILDKYLNDEGKIPDFVDDIHKNLLGGGVDPENSVSGYINRFKTKLNSTESTQGNTPKDKLKELIANKDSIYYTFEDQKKALKDAIEESDQHFNIDELKDLADGKVDPTEYEGAEKVQTYAKSYFSALSNLGQEIGIKDLTKDQLNKLLEEIKAEKESENSENTAQENSNTEQATDETNTDADDTNEADEELFNDLLPIIAEYYGYLNSQVELNNQFKQYMKNGDSVRAAQYRKEAEGIPAKAESVITGNEDQYNNIISIFKSYNIEVKDVASIKAEFEKLYNSHKDDVDGYIETLRFNDLSETEKENFTGTFSTTFNQETPSDRETFYTGMALFAKYVRAIELLEKSAKKDKVLGDLVGKLLTGATIIGGVLTFASNILPSPYKEVTAFSGKALSFGAGSITSARSGVNDLKNGKTGLGLLKFAGAGILGYMSLTSGTQAINGVKNIQLANFYDKLGPSAGYKSQLDNVNSQIEAKKDLIESGTLDKAGLAQAKSDLNKLNAQSLQLNGQFEGALAKEQNPAAVKEFCDGIRNGKVEILGADVNKNKESILKDINKDLISSNQDTQELINSTIEDKDQIVDFDAKASFNKDPNGTVASLTDKYGHTNKGWYAEVMARGTEQEKAMAPYALEAINKSDAGKAQIALQASIRNSQQILKNAQEMGPKALNNNTQAFADVVSSSKVGNKVSNLLGGDQDKATKAYKSVFTTIFKNGTNPTVDKTTVVANLQKDAGLSEKEAGKMANLFFKKNGAFTRTVTKNEALINGLNTQLADVDNAFAEGAEKAGMAAAAITRNTTASNNIANGFTKGIF